MKRMLCFRIRNRLGIRDRLEIRNGFAIVNVSFLTHMPHIDGL